MEAQIEIFVIWHIFYGFDTFILWFFFYLKPFEHAVKDV